jgi:hydroxymethylpyrimidine pyrophosphatase-like HAD family hydrolase
MSFAALASDYDGTLAEDGQVNATTLAALETFRQAGKRTVLVTGRELPDLRRVFDRFDLFDAVVAENGAVLFLPGAGEERPLAAEPPGNLVEALRAHKIQPLSVGHSIIATWEPNEQLVLELIRELGLEWQLTFNKGAVMCLPPGVNKASGLAAALAELGLSPLNVVAIGDAENDHAFLTACGCAVAVANALEAVKADADIVTRGARGAGVCELIERWLADPAAVFATVRRHDVVIGEDRAGQPVALKPDRGAVLIAGASGVGKSELATLLIERLTEAGNQVLVVDPEGDYDNLGDLAHLGDAERAPSADEAISLLWNPQASLAVNLLDVDVPDRPAFLGALLGPINELRARTGRPHWLILDEGHHLAPASAEAEAVAAPSGFAGLVLLTTHPKALHASVLRGVSQAIAVGEAAPAVLASLAKVIGRPAPQTGAPARGEVLFWEINAGAPVRSVRVDRPRTERQRHTRKYAAGRLGADKSFYFRGPEGALNLRAENLARFLELARGVDDATWLTICATATIPAGSMTKSATRTWRRRRSGWKPHPTPPAAARRWPRSSTAATRSAGRRPDGRHSAGARAPGTARFRVSSRSSAGRCAERRRAPDYDGPTTVGASRSRAKQPSVRGMARGVYRVRQGWADQHSVLVDFGGVLMAVSAACYRQSGYRPEFRKLRWKEGQPPADALPRLQTGAVQRTDI